VRDWHRCVTQLIDPRREIDERAEEERYRDGRAIDIEDLEQLVARR
jgi:hypothetical protein